MPDKRAAPTAGPHSLLVGVDGSLTTTMRISALLLACCLCALLEPLEARPLKSIVSTIGRGVKTVGRTAGEAAETVLRVAEPVGRTVARGAGDLLTEDNLAKAANGVSTGLQIADQINQLRHPGAGSFAPPPPGTSDANPPSTLGQISLLTQALG